MRLAVLISNGGTGSNLQAIIDALKSKKLSAEIAVVVSDTENAFGLMRAKKEHIPIHILRKGESLSVLLTTMYPVEYVVMAGWKKIIPDDFIDTFNNKIINLHPGLIPNTLTSSIKNPDNTKALWNRGKFGDAAVEEFINFHATYAGSSVHFLSHEFDFGKVLGRVFEKIQKEDTVQSLYERLKKKEHELLVEVLRKL